MEVRELRLGNKITIVANGSEQLKKDGMIQNFKMDLKKWKGFNYTKDLSKMDRCKYRLYTKGGIIK